jgi:hypothetical protein
MVDASAQSLTTANRVTLHYIKGQHFRAVHVDGAIGGITPRGLLHVAIYSERPAIPQMMVHELDAAGNLGAPVEVVSKPGIVRELEIDLLMGRDTLASLHQWLGEKLGELDELIAAAKKKA